VSQLRVEVFVIGVKEILATARTPMDVICVLIVIRSVDFHNLVVKTPLTAGNPRAVVAEVILIVAAEDGIIAEDVFILVLIPYDIVSVVILIAIMNIHEIVHILHVALIAASVTEYLASLAAVILVEVIPLSLVAKTPVSLGEFDAVARPVVGNTVLPILEGILIRERVTVLQAAPNLETLAAQ
jgi:hypothetical protein